MDDLLRIDFSPLLARLSALEAAAAANAQNHQQQHAHDERMRALEDQVREQQRTINELQASLQAMQSNESSEIERRTRSVVDELLARHEAQRERTDKLVSSTKLDLEELRMQAKAIGEVRDVLSAVSLSGGDVASLVQSIAKKADASDVLKYVRELEERSQAKADTRDVMQVRAELQRLSWLGDALRSAQAGGGDAVRALDALLSGSAKAVASLRQHLEPVFVPREEADDLAAVRNDFGELKQRMHQLGDIVQSTRSAVDRLNERDGRRVSTPVADARRRTEAADLQEQLWEQRLAQLEELAAALRKDVDDAGARVAAAESDHSLVRARLGDIADARALAEASIREARFATGEADVVRDSLAALRATVQSTLDGQLAALRSQIDEVRALAEQGGGEAARGEAASRAWVEDRLASKLDTTVLARALADSGSTLTSADNAALRVMAGALDGMNKAIGALSSEVVDACQRAEIASVRADASMAVATDVEGILQALAAIRRVLPFKAEAALVQQIIDALRVANADVAMLARALQRVSRRAGGAAGGGFGEGDAVDDADDLDANGGDETDVRTLHKRLSAIALGRSSTHSLLAGPGADGGEPAPAEAERDIVATSEPAAGTRARDSQQALSSLDDVLRALHEGVRERRGRLGDVESRAGSIGVLPVKQVLWSRVGVGAATVAMPSPGASTPPPDVPLADAFATQAGTAYVVLPQTASAARRRTSTPNATSRAALLAPGSLASEALAVPRARTAAAVAASGALIDDSSSDGEHRVNLRSQGVAEPVAAAAVAGRNRSPTRSAMGRSGAGGASAFAVAFAGAGVGADTEPSASAAQRPAAMTAVPSTRVRVGRGDRPAIEPLRPSQQPTSTDHKHLRVITAHKSRARRAGVQTLVDVHASDEAGAVRTAHTVDPASMAALEESVLARRAAALASASMPTTAAGATVSNRRASPPPGGAGAGAGGPAGGLPSIHVASSSAASAAERGVAPHAALRPSTYMTVSALAPRVAQPTPAVSVDGSSSPRSDMAPLSPIGAGAPPVRTLHGDSDSDLDGDAGV